MISEQDNSPEEVKNRIRSITKAIRYRARSEGGNMIKAFNDYMGSQGSGIGAQDRQMIKKRLGLSEKFSNYAWESNFGYGTKAHLNGLKKFGITSHHRKGFKPIHKILSS